MRQHGKAAIEQELYLNLNFLSIKGGQISLYGVIRKIEKNVYTSLQQSLAH